MEWKAEKGGEGCKGGDSEGKGINDMEWEWAEIGEGKEAEREENLSLILVLDLVST